MLEMQPPKQVANRLRGPGSNAVFDGLTIGLRVLHGLDGQQSGLGTGQPAVLRDPDDPLAPADSPLAAIQSSRTGQSVNVQGLLNETVEKVRGR